MRELGLFATPTSHKCEGIVNIRQQMGLMLPPPLEERAEQMESHQEQQESPRAKMGEQRTRTGLLLRQTILETNSPHQQGNQPHPIRKQRP